MKLIFVYNAKSGLKNHLMDALHKSFSPSTYRCDLCSLTYGHIAPKKEWKTYLKNSEFENEFMYVDQFQMKFPNLKVDFPVVFQEKKGDLSVLITSDELNKFRDVSKLIQKIKERITY